MRWCVFYDDHSTFSNEDGGPADAPAHGVIVVVVDMGDNGVRAIHGADFYWWRGDTWWGGDLTGFLDQSAKFGATWVKQGRMILPNDWQEIKTRAVDLYDEWRGEVT